MVTIRRILTRLGAAAAIAGGGMLSTSCAKNVHAAQPTLNVVSSAFNNGDTVPAEYTCDGVNVSPPLRWSKPPASTQSIAVVCDDPDAPDGDFTHWIVYNLPPTEQKLPESVSPISTLASGARQGQNDFQKIGYSGPCPPAGPAHHYHFHVYALDSRLSLADTAVRADIDNAMQGHILAQGELDATYGR